MKILVVDDDKDVREMLMDVLVAYLDAKPEDIVPSWNGAQALNIYRRSGPYDLVLTDFQMPVMNGGDFCKELVQEEAQPTAIIMVTGSSDSELKGLPEQVTVFRKGNPLSDLIELIKTRTGIQ